MENKRAWIYCRTAHHDNFALENQQEMLREYAIRKGYNIAGIVSEQAAGITMSRTGVQEISNVIEQGQMDVLVVKNLSRLGRNTDEVIQFINWMRGHQVELVCVDGTAPTVDEADIWNKLLSSAGN